MVESRKKSIPKIKIYKAEWQEVIKVVVENKKVRSRVELIILQR